MKDSSSNLTFNELKIVLVLAAIQFAHIVDFVVMMPLGPTLMDYFKINPQQFSLLASSFSFSAAISGVFFGMIADRFDRKLLLNIFFVGFILGTYYCSQSETYNSLLIARVLTGAFGGVINSVVYAIVPELIPYERRGKALGIVMSAFSAASILGVPLGVGISDYFSWHYSFMFIAFVSLLIFIAAYLMIPSMKGHIKNDKKGSEYIFQYFKTLAIKEYRPAYILISFASGSMFMLIPFLSPFAVKNMEIDPLHIKYMYFIGGCVTIMTARLFGVLTDKMGAYKLFKILCPLSFIPVLLFTHSGPIPTWNYILFGTFFMSLVSGRMIPCFTLISEIPSADKRGSYMTVINSLRSLGSAVFAFLGGYIVYENDLGRIENYDKASYLSVVMGLVTIYLAFKLNKLIFKRSKS